MARQQLRLLLLLLVLFAAADPRLGGARAEYTESLTVRSLPRGTAAHFRTALVEPEGDPAALFPPALARILDAYDAERLLLSFALGRCGPSLFAREPGADAPAGARLQVDLRGANVSDADARRRWRGITAELGALFSASLAQMDATAVVGLLGAGARREDLGAYPLAGPEAPTRFLHGALAREEVCTENLTPWLKLLPCRAAAGIGRLVDPVKVLSGEFLSLTLVAARAAGGARTLRQHLAVVLRADAAPSLRSLFLDADAAGELAGCPLASESLLVADGSATDLLAGRASVDAPLFAAWPRPLDGDGDKGEEELGGERPRVLADAVAVHRFATGYGQVRGGLAVRLSNRLAREVRVRYHDAVPWFLRVYLSSLRVVAEPGGARLAPDALAFAPAEPRGRPSQLWVELTLPARSSAVLSLEFDKAFVRLSEHPPDANRGFDLAPGVAVFWLPPAAAGADEWGERGERDARDTATLFTEPLLVALPTPDFSMPYNVITMTSTVVAFFVGSMLNSLLRKAPRIQQLMARPT